MKYLISRLLSGFLLVSTVLLLSIAVPHGIVSSSALADETPPEETLAQCFYNQVSQGKDVKVCDPYLDKERKALTSVSLSQADRCKKLQTNVETTSPEYLRLYEVRDCYFILEDNPFWASIYYGDSDASCQYNTLYKEYVCGEE